MYLLLGPASYKYHAQSGLAYVAKTSGKDFYLYDGSGNWQNLFVAGVNVGSGKPGYFPGDFGITKQDYLRWFSYISAMNANTIRVYVAQMPEFYQALLEYNDNNTKPIYLMHGVYLNEQDIAQYQDAYADGSKIRNQFHTDIKNAVDIIHGNAKITKTSGHAGGTYASDVSRYVIGWILGIEWEAEFVATTNENNAQLTSYDGAFLYTKDATPFEVFLAEAADIAISYETGRYKEQRPLALSNWVTSDPLSHPGEPNPEAEDAVSIDVEKLFPKPEFEAGFFASYHIYPYYPDLFSYESKYTQTGNTYKAYINELTNHHTVPLLVSEVGIPASRGIAHENKISGFNQGNVTEAQQGEMLVSLIGDIKSEGCMGALVFSWHDEWFKKTWNTQDRDIADRRAFWMDYQTNEQSFGLLSFDPGASPVCQVDGDISEWTDSTAVADNGNNKLYMKSDEKFLYIMAQVQDFENQTAYIPLDVIPDQGNDQFMGIPLNIFADFVLILNGESGSTVLVDPYYDATYYEYAINSKIIKRNPAYETKNNGLFVPNTLMLSRGLYLPETNKIIPYETFDTGKLQYGNSNPDAADYNSIADFYHKDGKVEIRLPWLLINVVDPSGGKILADLYQHGLANQDAGPINISILTQDTASSARVGSYSWDRWETPTYRERLKRSYYIVGDYFSTLTGTTVPPRSKLEIFWSRWNETAFSKIAYWFPIQPLLNYLIAFLVSVILYFFVVLIYIHSVTAIRTHYSKKYKSRVISVCDGNATTKSARINQKPSAHRLLVLSELLGQVDPATKRKLVTLMMELGYGDFVFKQFKTKDVDYTLLLIKMAGELSLHALDEKVFELIYAYPEKIELQYQGFLALALNGNHELLARICMDKQYTHSLSFRSLQEIFKAFTGNKQELYKQLLSSPDVFIARICIKRIGVETHKDLAAQIASFLDAENYNTVIDAARAVGQLRYLPAAGKLIELLSHPRWEVRSVAVTALAALDPAKYEDQIVQMLYDREWQVRFNAAQALAKCANIEQITKNVKAANDKYALEILEHVATVNEVWRTI